MDAWREEGLGWALRVACAMVVYRLYLARYDKAFDTRLPADPAPKVSLRALAVDSPNARYGGDYAPSPVRLVALMLQSVTVDVAQYNLVDLGCGRGRVVCWAAQHPFRAVVGVEFSAQLAAEAATNLAALRKQGRVRAKRADIRKEDAMAFEPPQDPTIYYLYNPFSAPILEQVLNNLRRAELTGVHYLIYFNAVEESLFRSQDFLEKVKPTLMCRWMVHLGTVHSLAIYRTRPRQSPTAAA